MKCIPSFAVCGLRNQALQLSVSKSFPTMQHAAIIGQRVMPRHQSHAISAQTFGSQLPSGRRCWCFRWLGVSPPESLASLLQRIQNRDPCSPPRARTSLSFSLFMVHHLPNFMAAGCTGAVWQSLKDKGVQGGAPALNPLPRPSWPDAWRLTPPEAS